LFSCLVYLCCVYVCILCCGILFLCYCLYTTGWFRSIPFLSFCGVYLFLYFFLIMSLVFISCGKDNMWICMWTIATAYGLIMYNVWYSSYVFLCVLIMFFPLNLSAWLLLTRCTHGWPCKCNQEIMPTRKIYAEYICKSKDLFLLLLWLVFIVNSYNLIQINILY